MGFGENIDGDVWAKIIAFGPKNVLTAKGKTRGRSLKIRGKIALM